MPTQVSRYVLLGVLTSMAASACGRGARVYAGQPVDGRGVRIEAREPGAIDGDGFSISLLAYNDTDEKIEINRNQIALVAPDGREFFRQGGRQIHWLPPRGRHPINIGYRIDPAAFRGAKGAYLRFDGFYAGSVRLDIPAMALGEPTGTSGTTNQSFAATGDRRAARVAQAQAEKAERPGVFRRLLGGGSDEPAKPATSSSLEEYRGPRRMLKTPGTKCAAMPVKIKDISEQMAFVIDELLLTELQQAGFEAIGPDDINALIGFEKTKEAVGCDEISCALEIGNALGVDYLTAGSAAAVEGSMMLTLKLIDPKGARVVARVSANILRLYTRHCHLCFWTNSTRSRNAI